MRQSLNALSLVLALAAVGAIGAGCNSKAATPAVTANGSGSITAGTTPGNTSLTHSSGYSVTLTLPSTSDGSSASIAATLQTSLPAGVPSPAAIRRAPRTIGTSTTNLVYLVLTPSSTVTFSSTPGFTYTLPSGTSIASGASAYVAFYDPALSSTGWVTILGPGSGSGQSIAFPGATGSLTLKGGVSYAFLLFSTSAQPVVYAPQSQCPAPAPIPTSVPSPLASPSPANANFVALQVLIDKSAQTGPPCANPKNVNIYIWGSAPSGNVYVTDAQGDTAPLTSAGAPPLPFYAGGSGSGNASQVIQLPNLTSARIYISVNQPLLVNAGNPLPWSLPSFAPVFDWLEYTMPANKLPTPSMVVNSTQIQMIGLDLSYQLNGQFGVQYSGLKAGFMSAVKNYSGFPANSPWSGVMFGQWPTRILGPNAVQYTPGGNPSLIGFNPGQFLDSAIQTAWNVWKAPNCLQYKLPGNQDGIPVNTAIFGQVDGNGNFVFYNPATVTACNSITATSAKVATLPSPFNTAYWTVNNQTPPCSTSTSWFTGTSSVLLQNGPFSAPTSLNICTNGALGTVSFPENAQYPHISASVGNAVSTAINRGLFSNPSVDQTQPECPASVSSLYVNSAPYLNQYAAALWSAVNAGFTPTRNGKPSGVYAIPYDDQCGFSSTLSDPVAQSLIVTINGN